MGKLMPISKKMLALTVLYGQIYMWTGGMFITVLYHLFDFYDETTVCYISEVYFLIMQAMGILAYSLLVRRKTAALGVFSILTTVIITFLTGICAVLSDHGISVVLMGSIMNFFIGAFTCGLLTRFATDIPREMRGRAFGIAYAIGSIGTYLISLPYDGTLTGRAVLPMYAVLASVSVILCILFLKGNDPDIVPIPANDNTGTASFLGRFNSRDVIAFVIISLFFVISTIGLHFRVSDGANVNIIFSRSFYAIGLILAGYIADKSRRSGAICAFIALGYGLLSPAFTLNFGGVSTVTLILGFILLGFPAVYRLNIFSDASDEDKSKYPFATYGLVGMLLGQAAGTALGVLLEASQTLLLCVILILYIICGLIFFLYLPVAYPIKTDNGPVLSREELREAAFDAYTVRHGFNPKQAEILRLLLAGRSNKEIAGQLYIAESTVKYHVKNILKITGCSNRAELISDFNESVM